MEEKTGDSAAKNNPPSINQKYMDSPDKAKDKITDIGNETIVCSSVQGYSELKLDDSEGVDDTFQTLLAKIRKKLK